MVPAMVLRWGYRRPSKYGGQQFLDHVVESPVGDGLGHAPSQMSLQDVSAHSIQRTLYR